LTVGRTVDSLSHLQEAQMPTPPRATRRQFLRIAGATAGATTVLARSASAIAAQQTAKPVSPNDRIRIALLGGGGMGQGDTATALKVPGVELVAVADIYDGRFTECREKFGKDVQTTRDYREVLSRKDVDAVIVATPDHWHARMAIDAMEAGKDVYGEKPMMHAIEEGARMLEAQKRTGRILQVGSQCVSSIVYEKARELFRSGALGQVNLIEGWTNRNSVMGALHWPIPKDASPETIDWDRFLGSAPKRPFEPARLFRWRLYDDYGTGMTGDLFVHLFSGMHFVTGARGPSRVFCSGGLRYWTDGREIPDVMVAVFDYPALGTTPAFNLTLKVNFVDGGVTSEWGETGFRFVGNEGLMELGGGSVTVARRPPLARDWDTEPAKDPGLSDATRHVHRAPDGYDDRLDHFRNFFDAVRTRKPVVEDALFGLRAAAPSLLCNLSYEKQRPVGWDPEAFKVAVA
jgi:predicted dehydrogenase